MLRRFTRLSLFAFAFFLLFVSFRPTESLVATGKVTGAVPGLMHVVVKAEGQIVAAVPIDSALKYDLYVTNFGQPSFDFFITDLTDTMLLLSDPMRGCGEGCTFNFQLPPVYEFQEGRAVCPKCKKTDETLKIVYGDGAPDEIVQKIDGKKVHIPCIAGGCLHPLLPLKWYCKRDKMNY